MTKDLASQLPPEAALWIERRPRRLVGRARPALVDIDGTLSDPSHRVHYLERDIPDWIAFSLAAVADPPLQPNIVWVNRIALERPVVLVSGRPAIAAAGTQDWLREHRVRWDALALRPPLDTVSGVRHKLRVVAALRELGIEPEVAVDDSVAVRNAFALEGLRSLWPPDAM